VRQDHREPIDIIHMNVDVSHDFNNSRADCIEVGSSLIDCIRDAKVGEQVVLMRKLHEFRERSFHDQVN
jgi:hypothetical protein